MPEFVPYLLGKCWWGGGEGCLRGWESDGCCCDRGGQDGFGGRRERCNGFREGDRIGLLGLLMLRWWWRVPVPSAWRPAMIIQEGEEAEDKECEADELDARRTIR